jgi:hypothetical protein
LIGFVDGNVVADGADWVVGVVGVVTGLGEYEGIVVPGLVVVTGNAVGRGGTVGETDTGVVDVVGAPESRYVFTPFTVWYILPVSSFRTAPNGLMVCVIRFISASVKKFSVTTIHR